MFTNCGAGDLGFARSGFTFDVIAELDERRLCVASLNHPGAHPVPGDVRNTWPEIVAAFRRRRPSSRPALLSACPPCQGMSSARGKRGREHDADAGTRDPRNLLVIPVVEVAKALRPRVIVLENVPAFLRKQIRNPVTGRPITAANLIAQELSSDYVTFAAVLDMADYAVPQSRRRTFLVLVDRSETFLGALKSTSRTPFPAPVRTKSGVVKTISLREALEAASLPPLDSASPESAEDTRRELHCVPVWNDFQRAMVAAIPAGSGLSAWENSGCFACGRESRSTSTATCSSCGGPLLRPVVRSRNGRYRLVRGFVRTSYRRMHPDRPAATVTTASGHVGSDITIHPYQHRVLSPLECAILQTFPKGFEWGDAKQRFGVTQIRAMIGEAVPPRFTELHGAVLARLLLSGDGPSTRGLLRTNDVRVVKAVSFLDLNDARER